MVRLHRCVVIGAGVLGASVAARLAETGMHVTLMEAGQPGRGTSRWSFAWVNSNDKGPRPYHDLNHAGLRAWARLAPALDGAAWYRPAGNLEVAASAAGRAELAARVRRLTGWGYPARLIDAAEAAQIEHALRPPGPDAMTAWFPDEAYLLTEPLIERLIARAAAHGATLLAGEQGRVTGLDAAPGRAPTVRTAGGAVLAADQVVCCAGRWTPGLAALAGAAGTVPLVAWNTPGSTGPARSPRPRRCGYCMPPASSCARTPAGCCTWKRQTPPWTCTPPRPNYATGPTNCSGEPGARSAASTRRASWRTRCACARCRPTRCPSSAACPAPGGSTSR